MASFFRAPTVRGSLRKISSLRKTGAAAVFAVPALLASPASATVFVYEQTATTIPGVVVSAAITVNGNLSDLPTVSSLSNPIAFGNLLAFDFSAPDALSSSYALPDFVAGQPASSPNAGFPAWSIMPGPDISFINVADTDEFIIDGGQISINSDFAGLCGVTGACRTSGSWDPVSEPSTAALLAVGLFFLGPRIDGSFRRPRGVTTTAMGRSEPRCRR
jgi:hypothetical protein